MPNFNLAHKKINDGIIISAYPEITQFYIHHVDYRLPFNLEKEMPLNNLNQKFFDNTEQITSLEQLHNIVLHQHGFIIFDEYAREKIPQNIIGYIEYNTNLIFEDVKNIDSIVWVYQF